LKNLALRSVQSVLSVGLGYEPQPPGLLFDTEQVRGYFIDFRAKTVATSAALPSVLVPAGLAQLALGWFDRSLAGDAGASQQFLTVCGLLEARGVERDGELSFPYAVPVPKHQLMPPWCSALAQAQAASVFVRAHLTTGDDRYATLAAQAIAPILPSSASGLLSATPDGPVPEESPSDPPSLILNGWIYALWGLWDVAVGLGDAPCRALFEESAACLRRTVDRYDVGWWSRYSLYPHRVADLAKPFYHRLHVDQLEVMHQLTGHPEFRQTARCFAAYDTPAHQVAVIAQKALFLALR
jgi:heparosan-N-sulfate-glucuronate 5-epimerase